MLKKKGMLCMIGIATLSLLMSGCKKEGGLFSPTKGPLDPTLPTVNYEATTGANGVATFVLPEGNVQLQIIDMVSEEPLEGINAHLVTDGINVAFVQIDTSGEYFPRITGCEETLSELISGSDTKIIGVIREMIKIFQSFVGGYQSVYEPEWIPNHFLRAIFKILYSIRYPTTLGELSPSFCEIAADFYLDRMLEEGIKATAIVTVHGLSGPVGWVLLGITIVEVIDQAALTYFDITYRSAGYVDEQAFEIWRPAFGSSFGAPLVFPLEEPKNPPSGTPGSIAGYVKSATTGDGIYGAKVKIVRTGQEATASGSGYYKITDVIPGTYDVGATCRGYYSLETQNVEVTSEETKTLNFSLSPTLGSSVYRVVLTWGENPDDMDSHLWTPDIEGSSYHIYFSSMGSSESPPYAWLDVDDVTSYGPETITIGKLFTGTYKFAVYHYAGSGVVTTSDAHVEIYDQTQLLHAFDVPSGYSESNWWWHIFNIDGSTGAITKINTIQESAPGPCKAGESK